MSSPTPVYLVSCGGEVEQAFARQQDAETFAAEFPDARISRHLVRQSIDEAVVIFDRRVFLARGATVLDRTNVVRWFVDGSLDLPGAADVEWFRDATGSGWHIVGFGIDRAALDTLVDGVIDRVLRLGHEAASDAMGRKAMS